MAAVGPSGIMLHLGNQKMSKANQTRCKIGVTIVFISLLLVVDFAASGQDKLTSQEIKELLTGNTMRKVGNKIEIFKGRYWNADFSWYYKNEEEVIQKSEFQINSGERVYKYRLTGKWWVSEEEGYCVKWRAEGERKNCFAIVKDGDKYVMVKDGRSPRLRIASDILPVKIRSFTFTVDKGKPMDTKTSKESPKTLNKKKRGRLLKSWE